MFIPLFILENQPFTAALALIGAFISMQLLIITLEDVKKAWKLRKLEKTTPKK